IRRVVRKIILEQISKAAIIDDCLHRVQNSDGLLWKVQLRWIPAQPLKLLVCVLCSAIKKRLLSHESLSGFRQNTLSDFVAGLKAKRKRPSRFLSTAFINAGTDLLPHTLARAVQSAQRGLTSVFGMGTGGAPAVRSPTSRSCQLSAVSSQQLVPE